LAALHGLNAAGYEVKPIRLRTRTAADCMIPVILVGGADASTHEEAARLGAEAILDAPLDVSRLRSAAETLAPVLRDVDVAVEARGYSLH
jgi:AmiR/NasT family two-component response regulator